MERKTLLSKNYLESLFLYNFLNKPNVTVLIGFIVVLILPFRTFILKLNPNKPSPTSLGITIFPITGILKSFYLKFLLN